jgi:hypothetical protein
MEDQVAAGMLSILVDHNIEGQSRRLWSTILAEGWLDLMPMRMVTLAAVGLTGDTNDRDVWRFAQAQQMVLLTANRRRKGQDSLEQTLREEYSSTSLPVVTIGNPNRMNNNKAYREQCATRLVGICLGIENYRGIGRIFIP